MSCDKYPLTIPFIGCTFSGKYQAMYIVREIFHLQFGRYKEASALIREGIEKKLLLQPTGFRLLSDFTGKGYRLILELPYASLADYEADLKKELGGSGWPDWYAAFKQLVLHSEREILKEVLQ